MTDVAAKAPGVVDRSDLEPPRLTDLGNAKRLVIDCGRDIHYVHEAGEWLIWDDRRWAWDQTGGIARKAHIDRRRDVCRGGLRR
jgi:hypothetical protein